MKRKQTKFVYFHVRIGKTRYYGSAREADLKNETVNICWIGCGRQVNGHVPSRLLKTVIAEHRDLTGHFRNLAGTKTVQV